jgi:colanic acid/amylovoran biosynthesis protein
MNILLINNHSVQNAGDHAIVQEALRLLHTTFPTAQIALVFNDTVSAQQVLPTYPILAAPLTWIAPLQADRSYQLKPAWQRGLLLMLLVLQAIWLRLFKRPLPVGSSSQRALYQHFATADLVVACGGGYIYAPQAGDGITGWFSFMLSGCVFAILAGKPLVLLPQSIGPLHDTFQRRATRFVVRHARLTCVRDSTSLQLLQELRCAARTCQLPDLAFGMPSAPATEGRALLERLGVFAQPERPLIGMTVLNWHGQAQAFAGQSAYQQAILAFIDTVVAEGHSVVLFAQCCGPSAAEDDRAISNAIAQQVQQPQHVFVMQEQTDPQVLQAAYGHMNYFIGTRMHSVILAFNAHVPALAIGYLHKSQSLFRDLGISAYCLDIQQITTAQLLAQFHELQATRPNELVQHYIEEAQQAKQQLGGLLQRLRVG